MSIPLLDSDIFSVGGVTYQGRDLVRAAQRWSDWAALETRIREGLASVARAADADDDVSEAELEAAAAEFRYDRDLISGQEMEVWLARWSLDADDWTEYLRRELLRDRWATELEAMMARYPVDPEEVEEVLAAEAVCSGFLGRIATKLAGRAGAAARAREEGWLPDEGLEDHPDALLARIDAGYGVFRERIVTEAALAAQLTAHRLDWIRVDCSCVSLPTREAASEAALCVREDGMDLDDVARSADLDLDVLAGFLEDCEAPLRDRLLTARGGDLIGPIETQDEVLLVLVKAKILPSLEDSAVRFRAQKRVLDTALAREIHDRVRWHRPELAT